MFEPLHNLFFAVRPPSILARRIAAMAATLGPGSQPAERLHVTLFILSGLVVVDPKLIAALREIGDAIARAPFRLTFDRMIGGDGYVALRPSRRNGDLIALHDRFVMLARAAGIAPGIGRFNPHITLIYRGGRVAYDHVAPISWIADEFVLIDSLIGATKHTPLGHWPLVAAPEAQLALL